MSAFPTPEQTLMLWTLLGASGQAPRKTLKPVAELAALLSAGLVGEGWRTDDPKTAWVEMTDKGWSWAAGHLAAPLPAKHALLEAWLGRIDAHLRRTNATLADLFMPAPEPLSPEKPKPPSKPRKPATPRPRKPATPKPRAAAAGKPAPAQLRATIATAYRAIAGGPSSVRVPLSALRAKLPEIDRETLDATLVGFHQNVRNKISLMPLEDPRQLTQAIRDAAVILKGEPMHFIWIDP